MIPALIAMAAPFLWVSCATNQELATESALMQKSAVGIAQDPLFGEGLRPEKLPSGQGGEFERPERGMLPDILRPRIYDGTATSR